jgi:hypothetical protein
MSQLLKGGAHVARHGGVSFACEERANGSRPCSPQKPTEPHGGQAWPVAVPTVIEWQRPRVLGRSVSRAAHSPFWGRLRALTHYGACCGRPRQGSPIGTRRRYSAHIKFSTSADRTARGRWDACVAGSRSPVPLPLMSRSVPPSFLQGQRIVARDPAPFGFEPMDGAVCFSSRWPCRNAD